MNGTSLNKGFTLIELIMVIVLLGVLAAVAIPKFIDLRQDAQQAALDGFAGALNAANSINYSGCSVDGYSLIAWGSRCINHQCI
jgi:MSHA pilin protein MshA